MDVDLILCRCYPVATVRIRAQISATGCPECSLACSSSNHDSRHPPIRIVYFVRKKVTTFYHPNPAPQARDFLKIYDLL